MNNPTKTSFYTSLGFVSVLCWSATVVLSRTVTTALGKYTAGAVIYLIGGVVACIIVAFLPKGFPRLFYLLSKILCNMRFAIRVLYGIAVCCNWYGYH